MVTKDKVEVLAQSQAPQSKAERLADFLSTERGRTVFAVAFLSGLFAAGYKATDNAIMNRYIGSGDEWLAPSAYLIIGAWVGVTTRIFYSLFFGSQIDRDFRSLWGKSGRMHRLALAAGSLSAIATLAVLRGNQGIDPSLVIILGAFQVAFMVGFDRRKGQSLGGGYLVWVVITLLGCVLASFSGSTKFPWENMAVILFVAGPINGYVFHLGQEGGREGDSISYPFWRFLWLAVTGTVGVFVIAWWRGTVDLLVETLRHAAASPVLWGAVILTMLFVFFNDTLETKAKREAGSSLLYVFTIVLVASVVLGTPIAIIGEWLSPGIFGGKVPHDPVVWLVRVVGFVLVVWGAYQLRKQLRRTAITGPTP